MKENRYEINCKLGLTCGFASCPQCKTAFVLKPEDILSMDFAAASVEVNYRTECPKCGLVSKYVQRAFMPPAAAYRD